MCKRRHRRLRELHDQPLWRGCGLPRMEGTGVLDHLQKKSIFCLTTFRRALSYESAFVCLGEQATSRPGNDDAERRLSLEAVVDLAGAMGLARWVPDTTGSSRVTRRAQKGGWTAAGLRRPLPMVAATWLWPVLAGEAVATWSSRGRQDGVGIAVSRCLELSRMELAKSCHYAVQGLVYLAGRERLDEPVLLRDIAAAVQAPEAFLSKIFQSLRASVIVRSHRGVSRGYTLARDPAEISLYDVIVATEGPAALHTADLTAGEAGEAFGDVWQEVEELVENRLRSVTLKNLALRPAKGGNR